MSEQLKNPEAYGGGNDNPWAEAMAHVPDFGETSPAETPLPETSETPGGLNDLEAVETGSDTPESTSETLDLDDPEVQLERNRDQFNQMTKRLVYIASAYPDLDAAPESVQQEAFMLEINRGRLSGENTGMHILGAAEAGDGMIVSGWKLQEYNADIAKREQLRLQNQQNNYLEDGAEESIELPVVDLEALGERAANLSSDYSDLQAFNQAIDKAQRFADLDTSKKLTELERKAADTWAERVKVDEQAELERLEENLAEIEEKLQQATASYQKLNIFQKAWRKFTSSDERGSLEQERARASRSLAMFKSQKNL